MSATGNLVSCSPTIGDAGGGFTINVVGTGSPAFGATGEGRTDFSFSGMGGPGYCSMVWHSATSVTLTAPKWNPGAATLTCYAPQPGEILGTLDFTFTTLPQVDSFSPATVPLAGGINVAAHGHGFSFVTAVTVGGVSVPFTINSDTSLTFAAPAASAGSVAVRITNASGTATAYLTYANPPLPASSAIPQGRARWRLTLHRRQFADTPWEQTIIAELTDARSVILDQKWNTAAQLTFTMTGHPGDSSLVTELATDVIAWRWDESRGRDVAMFRGIIDHAEDQLTEDSITTNYTCHDYFAMLSRRINTISWATQGSEQDSIVQALLWEATAGAQSSSGTQFAPGSYLPLNGVVWLNPDGSVRANPSGQLRDRTYPASTELGQAISDLAAVINGFDFAVLPLYTDSYDQLGIYYPSQGVSRTDCPLMYGSTVSSLTRTVDSASYGNYWRVLGNNGSSDPNAAQFFSETWNTDSNNVTVNPVGLWMSTDNAADVTIQSTLDQQVQGDLNVSGLLVPSYSVIMRPGAYRYGFPNMGDTVPLIVFAGRLKVNTTVRVLGINYAIGDDGQEDVTLTLGRPELLLSNLFTQADRDLDALVRR